MAPRFWAASFAVALAAATPAMADEAPKYGGILTYMIPADSPPSFDAQREADDVGSRFRIESGGALAHHAFRRKGDLVQARRDVLSSEGAEVARQMFGGDHSVAGEQAVLDIGEHGVRPAEGRVACSSAIGAGDVAFMDDTSLLGNAAKPLAAVADDSRSDHDAGA